MYSKANDSAILKTATKTVNREDSRSLVLV